MQKTIRILIYPNITFAKDLMKDSFIDVTYKFISQLNKLRTDLFFYIMLPERLEIFNLPNIQQIMIDLPTFPNRMRVHFNTFEILEKLPQDIDIVFSHLPEHTLQLSNLIYNKTQLRPEIIGYCHWFELDNVSPDKNTFNLNVLGLLEMNKCYLNTEYQKKLVLKQAAQTFSVDIIQKLDSILEVFYLGVEEKNVVAQINHNSEPIIVFNHRPDKYKYFDQFLAITDNLWKKRQDFQVWVPLLHKSDRPYIITDKFQDKLEYYKFLSRCLVGFSPKQAYGGWSVATLDGLMNGVPYIIYDADYYKELWDQADCFKNALQATNLLNTYLDDSTYRNAKAEVAVSFVRKQYIYENTIKKLSNLIDSCVSKLESYTNPSSLMIKNFVNLVKSQGVITKRELVKNIGWGESIPFTHVKRQVFKNYPIYDLQREESVYVYGTEQVTQKNLF